MREVYEDIAIVVKNFFDKNGYDKTLNLVLKSDSIMIAFTSLYEFFLKDGIPAMEKLELPQKQLFWDITKDYFIDKEKRVRGAKALYVLDLITEKI
jgi:hypothetical protein